MWINGNPLTLLMGLQADTTTMENSVEIKKKKKKKTRNKVTIQPSNTTISLLGIYPRKPELKDRMYPNVLCSTIVNSQDMKST